MGPASGGGLGSRTLNVVLPNSTTAGTTQFKVAQLTTTGCPTGAPVCVQDAVVTQNGGDVIGITVSGNPSGTTTSGNAVVATLGITVCQFDSMGVTALHYVQINTSSPGLCRDLGTAPPNPLPTRYIGIALETITTATTARVLLNVQQE